MSRPAPDDDHDAALVRRVLALVGDLRIDAALELITEDVVLELPFRRDGGPRRMQGPEALSFFRGLPTLLSRLQFEDVVVHGPLPSGLVVAEYRSDGLTSRGNPYRNTYVALFGIRDGRISLWREYFDPVVVTNAFLAAPA